MNSNKNYKDYKDYKKYKEKYLKLKEKILKQSGGINFQTDFDIADEIYFWSRQMMEHMFILHLGLEDEKNKLKSKALDLHLKWKKFMTNNFYDHDVKLGSDTVFLSDSDISKIKFVNKNELNNLINETESYKSNLVDILNTNSWIGWIFPGIAEHMLEESIYFKRKINGPQYSPSEEIEYINKHHKTEIAATAQLLDPSESHIIDIVKSYGDMTMSKFSGTEQFPHQWTDTELNILKGIQSSDDATLLRISIKYSKELTEFAEDTGHKIDNKQLKSIIHPVLAHHEYREFARFTERLNQLSI
ncbi:hypothetical protein QLL95_gp0748 [Cotonvirus japonicus]|uniref:DUF2935 domain-containing protein n=1 Tax=Cotonvirus japonicus TaxID=2811091 RepID=A0ABM7NT74_9VIRU|nr:hypothetical protein QLL95_gp0748 [Cotonvirus japonicus]BCS83375.1 hypothetical protein [Cotonvirus japonicus]